MKIQHESPMGELDDYDVAVCGFCHDMMLLPKGRTHGARELVVCVECGQANVVRWPSANERARDV